MKHFFYRLVHTPVVLVALAVGVSGCSGSPITVYHTLGAGVTVASQPPNLRFALPSLGVGPVKLPSLLDRQGVVLRKDAYTVEVSELNEWGGELEDEFVRALSDRFQAYLPNTSIRTIPWELEQTPHYQLSVTVSQFDGIPGKVAYLRGRWQLQLAANGKGVRLGSFDLMRPVTTDTIPALVRVQSQLVDDLALHVLNSLQ